MKKFTYLLILSILPFCICLGDETPVIPPTVAKEAVPPKDTLKAEIDTSIYILQDNLLLGQKIDRINVFGQFGPDE